MAGTTLLALVLGASALRAQTHVLVISGVGGEAKYSAQFKELGSSLSQALHARFAIPDSDIAWLSEDSTDKSPYHRGLASGQNIERAVDRIAKSSKADDQIVFVLIGHGIPEGAESKLAIPGPDLTVKDYARLLGRFASQRVAFVNLSTASGDMLPLVAGPNRVVITATKTSFERNELVFAQYFVEALAKEGADVDKDGRVSLLEAFTYANTETKRHYDDASTLRTEHAQMNDTGDGKADPDPTGRGDGSGLMARRFYLDAGKAATQAVMNNPELSRLYKLRFSLEDQVDSLKKQKSKMTPDAYDTALEKVLLDLARTSLAIRKMEGRE
jgi:hypothetical protein